MKSFTSIIFLLLFATALAVPAVIFYTKWANKKADEAALQVPDQNVSTATMFTGFQDKSAASAEGGGRAAPTARPALSPGESTADGGAANGAAEAGVPGSTSNLSEAYFSPKSGRDPFITPAEYAIVKANREKLLAAERRRLLEGRQREKLTGGENLIKLQGIIGPNVIINGEMYAVGNIVRGVKVRIVKIMPTYIIAEYQGKRFTKVMR
jgi:hypothetical protein